MKDGLGLQQIPFHRILPLIFLVTPLIASAGYAQSTLLEHGTVLVGSDAVTVALTNTYVSPVVVASARYQANSVPVVTRVSNVTGTSFDVRLQNPSGSAIATESISYLVVEEGVWSVDGVNFEAQTYLSTVTDEDGSWVGEAQSYGQSYTNPVVIGQVMSENDPSWSTFWCQGGSRGDPPSATTLRTGKMVGEDSDVTRADETVGFLVFEAGHGTLGGAEYEARLGGNSIQGVDNSPPYSYSFDAAFIVAPQAALTTVGGMNGVNGGWAQGHGPTLATTTALYLSMDEDQVGDSERNHIAEQVGYVVFGPLIDNDPPLASDDSATTDEDVAVIVDVLANDSDGDGDALTVTAVTQGTSGTVVNNGTDVTYTPAADACGADSFGYTVGDGNGGSDTATVNVTVTCINDSPVAVDDTASVAEGDSVIVDVLANDNDVDGSGLTVSAVTQGANGTVVESGTDVTYTHDGSATTSDSFTYTISDGEGDTDTATVTVAISSVGAVPFEHGSVLVGGDTVTVNLLHTYANPVVVCSAHYDSNSTPVVTRVSNVTSSRFDVRLQNPSGGAVAAESVSYLVVEEGVWNVDGVSFEAQKYLSTVTDENGSWVGEAQSYGQSYTTPVVLGQVMSENDPAWSAFWCQGGSRTDPPSATTLKTGKMVGEDSDVTRADETVGFIVFEAGHGTINGVEFEAFLGADTVQGAGDSPPYLYDFDAPFTVAPGIALTTLAGVDGPNGGWAQTHGPTMATATSLYLSIDEDQIGDSERNHINEQVGYVVFGSSAAPSPTISIANTPLSPFASVPGTPSVEQSYTVSGSILTDDITITAPSDFEVSLTSDGGWTSSLVLPPSGGSVAETTIYVRFNRATEGTTSGNISHSSTGATTRNVAVSGTAAPLAPVAFNILLGRPTDESVTANLIPDQDVELFVEYGPSSGSYPDSTDTFSATADEPIEIVIGGLAASSGYFYRIVYRQTGTTEWNVGTEYSFDTQKARGSAYTFTIISDSHLGQYGGQTDDEYSLYEQTLANVGADQPDFHIDLGDTFAMDPQPLGTGMTEAEAEAAYLIQRPFLGAISHSIPFYLAIGNHENEEGWNFDDVFTAPDQSLAVVGLRARKIYFPNPVPDDFYTGNADPLPEAIGGDTLREDYFSWEWGDALFVVLDPYHYSLTWPSEGDGYGGEGQDGEPDGDRWDWTLGIEQYLWLKNVLETSDAEFKFVMSHHVTGGATPYGRGGISAAPYFEWGGQNADGTWGWDTERPASEGWDVPVHQLLVDNGVDVYFHGHDHIYAYEELDGIVYLEAAKPDDAGYDWEPYGYGYTEDLYPDGYLIPNSGHIRVLVSPAEVTIEYVRSYLPGDGTNGTVAHAITIPADSDNQPPVATADVATVNEDAAVTVDVLANDSDGDGDPLTVSSVEQGTSGTVVNNDTDVTYTPAVDFCGSDSFDYTVSDGRGGSDTATVDVTVTCVNDVPMALNDTTSVAEGAAVTVDVLANDSDVEGGGLTVTGVTQGANGSVVNNGTDVTYTHDGSATTSDSFSYTIEDGDGGTATATVTVTITETPNSPPMAVDDSTTTDEDQAVTVDVLANDSDGDGDPLTVSAATQGSNGSVVNNSTDVTYTPADDFCGGDSFGYTVSDGLGGTATGTVSVTVTCINDAPVTVDDTTSVTEGESVTVDVLANDSDVEGGGLTVTGVTQGANGTVVNNGTDVTYTHDGSATSSDSFTYTVEDGDGGTATATVTVTITEPPNTPPVTVDDTTTTDEDQAVTVDVLANDSDGDGDPLTVSAVTQGASGSVVNNGSDVTYTPIADFCGADSFTYTVSDGRGGAATGAVNVTVTCINDDPVAVDDTATVVESGSVTVDVLANDSDVEGSGLTVTGVTQGANGTVVNNGTDVTYTHDGSVTTSDSFTYTLGDGEGGTDTATVDISVRASGGHALWFDGSDDYVQADPIEGAGPLTIEAWVRPDQSNAEAHVFLCANPSGGGWSLEINGGRLTMWFGTTSGWVPLQHSTPLVAGQWYHLASTYESGSGRLFVNGDPSTPSNVGTLAQGSTLRLGGLEGYPSLFFEGAIDEVRVSNVVRYSSAFEPATQPFVPDSETLLHWHFDEGDGQMVADASVSANDGTLGSSGGTASDDPSWVEGHPFPGDPVNESPVAVDDAASVAEGQAVSVDVLANDVDVDGSGLTVTSVTQGANGIVVNSGTDVTYTHDGSATISDSFTYTIEDGEGDPATATVTVTITGPPNTPPIAADDSSTTNEDESVTIDVLANDDDDDGDALTVSAITQPANGSVVNNGTDVTYSPDTDSCGTDTFTYTASDGNGGSDTATVDVGVTCLNDSPIAVDDTASVAEGGSVTVAVLANDSDPDGSGLTVTSVTQGANGTVVNNGTDVSYNHDGSATTSDSFSYTIEDGEGDSASATVDVVVGAVPPNIVFIIVDDIGIDTSTELYPGLVSDLEALYTARGNPDAGDIDGSPASMGVLLSRIADQGIMFSSVLAQPVCSPTRAAVLTGLYAAKTGVTAPGSPMSGNHTTFADILKSQAGYRTALFGKWHLGTGSSGVLPQQVGFDLYRGNNGGAIPDFWSYSYHVQDETTVNPATYRTEPTPTKSLAGIAATTYAPVVKAADAIEAITDWETEDPDAPWFVWLSFNNAHTPLHVPNADTLDADSYAEVTGCGGVPGSNNVGSCGSAVLVRAMTNAVDTVLDSVLATIESLDPNTFVIFVGDNGTEARSIDNLFLSTSQEGKGTVYQSGAWVAFGVAGPGIPAGLINNEYAHVADVFATCLELAGLEPPATNLSNTGSVVATDSVSLTPILFGAETTVRDPDEGYILTETSYLGNKVGARNARYKVICTGSIASCEFFDLIDDPLEEYPLTEPGDCTDYRSIWVTSEPEWNYCRLLEVVESESIF